MAIQVQGSYQKQNDFIIERSLRFSLYVRDVIPVFARVVRCVGHSFYGSEAVSRRSSLRLRRFRRRGRLCLKFAARLCRGGGGDGERCERVQRCSSRLRVGTEFFAFCALDAPRVLAFDCARNDDGFCGIAFESAEITLQRLRLCQGARDENDVPGEMRDGKQHVRRSCGWIGAGRWPLGIRLNSGGVSGC